MKLKKINKYMKIKYKIRHKTNKKQNGKILKYLTSDFQ